MEDTTVVVALLLGGSMLAVVLLVPPLRRYLLWRGLIDHPSARRSHRLPTPRGGGIALALVCTAGIVLLHAYGRLSPELFRALLGGGGLVFAVSVLDDHRPLPWRWRLVVHGLAVTWAIHCLGVPQWDAVPGGAVTHGLLTGLGLVWLINLYNFMDGIDGLAAGHTVCVGLAGAWLLGMSEVALLLLLLAGAAAGFLVWNRPPAGIFMGDSGSCLLGFLLGVAALASIRYDALPLACWLILPGVFLIDAGWTLLRRVVSGQRWWQAHRDHAYQHAALRYGHGPVTVVVMAITVFWLLPWAYRVQYQPGWDVAATIIAWAPLLGLALWFKAGRPYRR